MKSPVPKIADEGAHIIILYYVTFLHNAMDL